MLLKLIHILFASRAALLAENLFLRKQLALFAERKVKRRRTTAVFRISMIVLSKLFDWRSALAIVKPETFVEWHRTAFKAFWRWKSRKPGRPAISGNLCQLIRQMARDNPIWGRERIADELLLNLGIKVSPRTVAKYLKRGGPSPRNRGQRWSIFMRNHAKAIVACDFITVVTVRFRTLYVFVAMEIGSRRILHTNVTEHPTADWTIQQLREFLTFDHPFSYFIHDRQSVFSAELDRVVGEFGLKALKTPIRTPVANAHCERVIGTIRRECLDWVIPLGESHLRYIIRAFVSHYNRGRPHSALGPGIPEPCRPKLPSGRRGHKLPNGYRVTSRPVLGGLHHEYGLEKEAA